MNAERTRLVVIFANVVAATLSLTWGDWPCVALCLFGALINVRAYMAQV